MTRRRRSSRVLSRDTAVRAGAGARSSDGVFDTRTYVALALLVLTTFFVFLPVLSHEFTNWDDPPNVLENPLVMSPSAAGVREVWRRPVNNMYAPVTYMSWMGDAAIGGGAARAFHATNLFLHIGSALLVFFILRHLLRTGGGNASAGMKSVEDTGAVITKTGNTGTRSMRTALGIAAPSMRAIIASAAGALIFALHPLQAESVGWVTARKDVLSGFFSLLAILMYLKSEDAGTQVRDLVFRTAAVAAFLLAMLSKATVVALPLALLALDVLVRKKSLRETILRLLPWFAVSAILTWPAMSAQPMPEWLKELIPLWKRPLLAAYALVFYVGKVVWPVGLSPVYTVHATDAAASVVSIYYLLLVLLGIGAAIYFRGKTAASAAVFIAPLLPILGFFPFLYQQISLTADRYVYLSMLAVALVVAWTVERLWPRETARKIGIASLAVVIAGFAFLTNRQARFWKDSETLWRRAVAVAPGVPEAHSNLAFALHHSGNLAEAEKQLELAVKADPDFNVAWNMLGLLRLQRAGPDAAIPALRQTVRALEKKGYKDKRLAEAYNNLGAALMRKNAHLAAEQQLRKALHINPTAETYANLVETLEKQKRAGEALRMTQDAARRGIKLPGKN